MPDPTPQDDALLARLNALKKSSVSFETSFSSSLSPSTSSTSTTVNAPDDLASRFARLGSASPSGSPKPSRTTSSNDTTTKNTPSIAPGAPSYLEGVAEGIGGGETESNIEDEKSLADLIDELGPDEEWKLSASDGKDISKLLKDIKTILPEVQKSRQEELAHGERVVVGKSDKKQEELTDWENVEVDIGSRGVNVGREEQHDEESEDGEEKKRTEDDEADDVIARVMAELEISRKYDPPSPPSEEENSSDSGGEKAGSKEGEANKEPTNSKADSTEKDDLTLPSAPTSIPEDDFDRTQALEDALTARLAALAKPQSDSLGLPSAPSFSPAKKPPNIQSNLAKAIEDEVDTWCCICTDDAVLKCPGCDGDLYCQNCWMEGHRGESAGYEERRHKAILYSKDKKKKKQAAAG